MKPESAIVLVLVLAIVFYLTWITTRFVAGKSRLGAGRFMKVVDRMALSHDKSVMVVKIGGSFCVIGVSSHDMRLIKTLSAQEAEAFEVSAESPSPAGKMADEVFKGMQSFGGRLAMAMHRPPRRSAAYRTAQNHDAPDTQQEPQQNQGEAPNVIDLLDQRVRQRKETKRW